MLKVFLSNIRKFYLKSRWRLFPSLSLFLIVGYQGPLWNPITASLDSNIKTLALAKMDLYPNIETVGIVVSGANLPENAVLMYRQSSDPTWRTGHPLVQIDDGRLVGSLFGLSPLSTYEIKVIDGGSEINGSTTTQPDELQFTPTTVIYVNDDAAAGGDGSLATPLRTIQEGVNRAGPGTQVLVADGLYHETITLPSSGAAGNWIQVKAQGSGAILDGSANMITNPWKAHASRKNVWFTKIAAPITYLGRDQKRFYAYDDLSGVLQGMGHGGIQMNEGWYFEPSTSNLYVRSLNEPSTYKWQTPTLNRAFDVNGRDWLWIEGFEMRFYGGHQNGCGICTLNSSHLVIRKNNIHNIQLGIFFDWNGGEDRANDTRIEYNQIHDPAVNDWPWAAVKGTSMEGTAIVARGHVGAIIRGNEIHDLFNGIYSGSSAGLENHGIAFDVDIYNNHIHHISDDGFEPEGTAINQRFRNNVVDTTLVGVSIAPVTQGPVWVLRSTFSNYTGRGIKWDRNSDGLALVYHNTFWTNAPSTSGMSMISPAHNALLRNNIFQSTGFSIEETPVGSTGHDWNYDNWYTTSGASNPRFKWENVLYGSIGQLCTATGLECQGYADAPGLTNPAGGDFTLMSSSPNIDRGEVIPGINDKFSGAAPDVGMYEYASVPTGFPAVISITRAGGNPTDQALVTFTVTFSHAMTGMDTVAPFSDFTLVTTGGITGASIVSVQPASVNTYTVDVNTGSGSGSIRLDVIDDDSMINATGIALGGPGAGNGSFASGEAYTINKGVVAATSILRADPNPASSEAVHFTVNFSTQVNGVGVDDFTLVTTGLSGAAVLDVAGSGATYNVTVNTGTGEGTARLDLVDNDSVISGSNEPLGGVGNGNGSFSTGETYVINKTISVVTSSLRADPNPTAAGSVRFLVQFSEPVSGVDAADFAATVNGSIVNAGIVQVTGSGGTYAITVNTGTGSGTVRLDVVDNDSIVDSSGLPLGGMGAGNGSFAAGEAYTVNRPVVNTLTESFRSNGSNDGWILETSENGNQGGTKNNNAATFNLGDDSADRQYRVILHFPTSSLPDRAVVTQIILVVKKQGLTGTDPFTTHQGIAIDIRKGPFGSLGPFGVSALQTRDFQAPADLISAGIIQNNPVGDSYWSVLNPSANPFINLKGITQFRLMFQLDDNDDLGQDYLAFFSGDAQVLSDRPLLQVNYYLP